MTLNFQNLTKHAKLHFTQLQFAWVYFDQALRIVTLILGKWLCKFNLVLTLASSTYGVNNLGLAYDLRPLPRIHGLRLGDISSPDNMCEGGVGISPLFTALASVSCPLGMMCSNLTRGSRSLMISRSSWLSKSRRLIPFRLTLCWVLLSRLGSSW